MAFTSITKLTVGKFISKAFLDAIIDNLNDLYARFFAAPGTVNGSFEFDNDADDVPDGWTWTAYTGGTKALSTTQVENGTKGFKITHPGGASTGGGYLTSTDMIPVNAGESYYLEWYMMSATANVDNRVEILWYDKSGSSVSTTTAYSATTAVASVTRKSYVAIAPATATQAKLRFTGGHTAQTTAGDVYYDAIRFEADVSRRLLGATSDTAATMGNSAMTLAVSSSGNMTHNGNTVWTSGNDGSGSGLDADTVDGYNVGNSTGNIPRNNNTLCVDLAAEFIGSTSGGGDLFTIRYASTSATSASIANGATATYTLSSFSGNVNYYIPAVYASTGYNVDTQIGPPGVNPVVYAYIWRDDFDDDGEFLSVYNNSGGALTVRKAVVEIAD